MNDVEMTKLCMVAMGIKEAGNVLQAHYGHNAITIHDDGYGSSYLYAPLHDDSQAMALVKKFRLDIYGADSAQWGVQFMFGPNHSTKNADLNRAIVECIARENGREAETTTGDQMTPARLKSLSEDLLDSLFDNTRSQRLRYIEEWGRDLWNEGMEMAAQTAVDKMRSLSCSKYFHGVPTAIRAKRLPDSEGT